MCRTGGLDCISWLARIAIRVEGSCPGVDGKEVEAVLLDLSRKAGQSWREVGMGEGMRR